MLKYLLSLILSICLFSDSFAQGKSDTLMYYMQNSGDVVENKDQADFILFIMPKNPDNNLYPILQYYKNGKRKLIASSSSNSLSSLNLEGPFMAFFPTGKRQISTTYANGQPTGDEISYYPNGNVYTQRKLDKNRILMNECRDSTGTVLATNGNGRWLKFSNDFKIILSEGNVANSLKDGKWNGYAGKRVYKKGNLISGDDAVGEVVSNYFYDNANPEIIRAQYVPFNLWVKGDYLISNTLGTNASITLGAPLSDTASLFNTLQVPPSYPGGMPALHNYLRSHLLYPSYDNVNNIQGTVRISFYVETDGSLTNFKIVSAPSNSLGDEVLRVMKFGKKWIPGSQNGKPIRTQFIFPINFSLY